MTDTARVRQLIAEKGLKLEYIAKCLGISRYCLSQKLDNKSEFKTGEVQMLCNILGITSLEMKEELFFCQLSR